MSAQPKKVSTKAVVTEQRASDKVVIEAVVDVARTFDDEKTWPLQSFCEELCNDLFKWVS